MTPLRARSVIVAAALMGVTACATGDAAPAPSTTGSDALAPTTDGVAVEVENIAYKPAEIRVLRGTEVTWTNADDQVAHTVTSGIGGSTAVAGVSDGEPSRPDGVFDGALPADGVFSFVFSESGTFAYFCEIHPSMRGTVTVD